MAKKFAWLLVFICCLVFLPNEEGFVVAATETKEKIAVAVNDHLLAPQQSPELINHISYFPAIMLFQELNLFSTYNATTKTVKVYNGEKWLILSIPDQTITMSDGRMLFYHIPVINGVTYAPLRLVAEFFDYNVKFLPEYKVIRIFNKTKLDDAEFIEINGEALKSYYSPKKIAYLTFDDGPNIYTTKILDILKNNDAAATFFMLEGNIRSFPEEVNRMVREGHYPALHSVSHNKVKLYSGSATALVLEMEQTRKTLFEVAGVDSFLTRAPFGSKPYMSAATLEHLVEYGYKMWDWTIDTEDWRYGAKSPQTIVKKVKSGIQHLEGTEQPVVILFHDSKATSSVLGEIINFLHSQGYELVAYDPKQHVVVNFWKDNRL